MKPLFIFEMANNHGGSVEHGLAILREFEKVCRKFRDRFDFGFKLQYRDLDTFIHPEFKDRRDLKYVKRFLETRLSFADLKKLKDEMKALGFVTFCTPYDEKSVDWAERHDFDGIKIASASITDWPLLERIAKSEKPILASTGGVLPEELDKVVSFFEHRKKSFSLMHCVSVYPAPDDCLQLDQIDFLKARYPGIKIGYSTHERPDNFDAVKLAAAKGAMIFEKHVGLEAGAIKLNGYSVSPEQAEKWLSAALSAFRMGDCLGRGSKFSEEERKSLLALERGVFAGRDILKGEKIEPENVFLAIPVSDGQLTAQDLSKYTLLHVLANITKNQPVFSNHVRRTETREKVWQIVQRIKAFLKESRVVVPPQLDLEISHHYGIDRFYEFGAAMITSVNRAYCRKLIILLPGQTHPEQVHELKEETFVILHGDVRVAIDGVEKEYKLGEAVTVEKKNRHTFKSERGAVIEEISTTHYGDDSHYTDPVINQNPDRKTFLTFWME